MHAIILAAGCARRMGAAAKSIPKSLLEVVAGRSPMQHHLTVLAEHPAVDSVTIVVGHEKEKIRDATKDSRVSVQYVENDIFADSGSGYSLSLALERIDTPPFLWMDADIFYAPALISEVVEEERDCLLASARSSYDDEMVKVTTNASGTLRDLNKQVEDGVIAESVGIVRVESPTMIEHMRQVCEDFRAAGVAKYEWEEIVQAVAADCDVAVVPTEQPWIEIDFPYDLAVARDQFRGMTL